MTEGDILSTLSKLVQHMNGPLVLTGSLAVAWHLTLNGRLVERRPFNDIDIVVEGISDLPPYSPSLMSRVLSSELFGIVCGFVSAEDLTARLMAVLYGVTTGEHVDPKYYDKFSLISEFADMDTVREIWSDYRKTDYLLSFDEAADAVHRRIAKEPGALRKDSYGQDVDLSCPWCEHSSSFPVSPRSKIFEILGYV